MRTAIQLFRLLPQISISIMSAIFRLSKTEFLLMVRAKKDMQKGRTCLGTHCGMIQQSKLQPLSEIANSFKDETRQKYAGGKQDRWVNKHNRICIILSYSGTVITNHHLPSYYQMAGLPLHNKSVSCVCITILVHPLAIVTFPTQTIQLCEKEQEFTPSYIRHYILYLT